MILVLHDDVFDDRTLHAFAMLVDVPDDDIDIVRMALQQSQDGGWTADVFNLFTMPQTQASSHRFDPAWRRSIVQIAARARTDRAISALFAVGAWDDAIDQGRWDPAALAHALDGHRWAALDDAQRQRCIAILAHAPQELPATGAALGYTSRFLAALRPYRGRLLTWLARIPESHAPIPIDGWDELCAIAAEDPWIAVEVARLGGMDDRLWRSARRSPSALDAFVIVVGAHGWQAWRNASREESRRLLRDVRTSPLQAARISRFIGPSDQLARLCRQRVEAYAAYLSHACHAQDAHRPRRRGVTLESEWASPYLAACATACDHIDANAIQTSLRTRWDGNLALATIGARRTTLPESWLEPIALFCARNPSSVALAPQMVLQRPSILDALETPDDFLLAIQSVEALVRDRAMDIPSHVRRALVDHAVRLADERAAIAVARLVGHDPRLFTLAVRSRNAARVDAYIHAIAPMWAHIADPQRRDIIDGVALVPETLPVLASVSGYDRRHIPILERSPFVVGRYIAALGREGWRSLPQSVQRMLTGMCMHDAFACLDACGTTGHVRRFVRAVCRYPSTAADYIRRVPWTDIPPSDQSDLLAAVAGDPEYAAEAALWCGAPIALLPAVRSSPTFLRQFLKNVARNPWRHALTDGERRQLMESIASVYAHHPWMDAVQTVVASGIAAASVRSGARTVHGSVPPGNAGARM